MEPCVLIFVYIACFNIVRWALDRSQAGFLQQHQRRVRAEVAALRRQQALAWKASRAGGGAKLAGMAKSGALQRLIYAKEQELTLLREDASLSGCRDGGAAKAQQLAAAVSAIKAASIALAVVALWGRPLLYISPELVGPPFSGLLLFPHRMSQLLHAGCITVLPWVALCDRASALLARTLLPAPFLAPCTEPLPTLLEGPEH